MSTMTQLTPAQQQASAWYAEMTSRQYAVFKAAVDAGKDPPEPVDVLRGDLLHVLMKLAEAEATVRRLEAKS